MVEDGDEVFMREALRQARRAGDRGEVPVGAVVVAGDQIVGRGYNRPISTRDPTGHAEIVALRRAARKLDNYRLTGAEVFVTLEPCIMCFGAFVHARVRRVVFGAADPKVGALGSGESTASMFARVNHRFEIRGGVLADASGGLIKQFFASRRRRIE